MGTETVAESYYEKVHLSFLVKLNNPLMGTETDDIVYNVGSHAYVLLN